MWDSSQSSDSSRPQPFVRGVEINTGSLSVISQPDLWNGGYAWAYPDIAVNARGDIAGPVFDGGPPMEPQVNVLIDDGYSSTPPPWENYFEAGGTDAANRIRANFLGARPQDTYSDTWVGTGYVMDGSAVSAGSFDPNLVPTAFWFGREQDNPNVLPFSSDAGDTLATATLTGLGPGTSRGTFLGSIWNALYGTKDVEHLPHPGLGGHGADGHDLTAGRRRSHGYPAPPV